jgi:hypothetical protein
MYGRGTGHSSSGSLFKTSLVSFWSLGFIAWATKILLCLFFVGAEFDPRGHDLSHLKPGVDIGEMIRVSRGSFYDLINGPDTGQI